MSRAPSAVRVAGLHQDLNGLFTGGQVDAALWRPQLIFRGPVTAPCMLERDVPGYTDRLIRGHRAVMVGKSIAVQMRR